MISHIYSTEVSLLLGVSRASVYRYLASGEIESLQDKRKTIIRRTDLEEFFDNASPYKRRSYGQKGSRQYYTMTEIVEKFKISRKASKGRLDRLGILLIYKGSSTFFNKSAVDIGFTELLEEANLNNYYMIPQIMEMYNMTTYGVRAFVPRHQIPSKNVHGETVHSKVHIDDVKEFRFKDAEQYLSVEQIIEKYKLTRDSAYNNTKYYKAKKVKKGKFTFFL